MYQQISNFDFLWGKNPLYFNENYGTLIYCGNFEKRWKAMVLYQTLWDINCVKHYGTKTKLCKAMKL